MYSTNFVQDPTVQRLNALYTQLCSPGAGGKDTLILDNNCFEVISKTNVIKTQLCLTNFGFPADSASLVSTEILPNETFQLFNNGTPAYYAGPLPTNKTFVRGIILLVNYPNLDVNGVSINPALFNCELTLTSLAINVVSPTVSAGPSANIQAPINTVTLTGLVSGNGGAIVKTILWTKISAPLLDASAIVSPSTASTVINGLIPGQYVYRLTVTDSNGLTTTSTVTVNVADIAQTPPTVNAGSNVSLALSSVLTTPPTLSGSATVAGASTSLTTEWVQTGGPQTVGITDATATTTTITGITQPGAYTFELTATDNQGFITTSTVVVTVFDEKSINLPLNTFFSHFSNPVTTDPTQILNSVSVTNTSAIMPICVTALLIYDKTDTTTSVTNNSCNC